MKIQFINAAALADGIAAVAPDLGFEITEKNADLTVTVTEVAERTVTVTPDNPRSMPADELARRLNEAGGTAEAAASLEEGLARARELAGGEGVVIASGSLYFAGGLRSVLGLPWR